MSQGVRKRRALNKRNSNSRHRISLKTTTQKGLEVGLSALSNPHRLPPPSLETHLKAFLCRPWCLFMIDCAMFYTEAGYIFWLTRWSTMISWHTTAAGIKSCFHHQGQKVLLILKSTSNALQILNSPLIKCGGKRRLPLQWLAFKRAFWPLILGTTTFDSWSKCRQALWITVLLSKVK